MSRTNLIVALDIGSGKITAVAAAYDAETNSLRVVTGKSVPCRGFNKGIVSDMREASSSISEVINYIEEKAEQEVGALYVALRGDHLSSFTNHGIFNITRVNKEITTEDIEQAIANARSVQMNTDSEIISVVPQGFYIDCKGGITNPEGMEGSLLEVDVHITTGASSTVKNLLKAFSRVDLRVDGKFYGLVCLAEGVLTQEEKESYCLIIDLGGGTISVGIWAEGNLIYTKDFPFGCDIFTKDIHSSLHTPTSSAVEIKERYGVAYPTYLEEETTIQVPSMDGKNTSEIKKSYLLDIIQPRAEEIFETIKENIEKAGFGDFLREGYAVITGGGSLMPGIEAQCCQTLGLKEAHKATVRRDIIDAEEKFYDPMYATAMSLAAYAAKREMLSEDGESDIVRKSPVLKFFNMLKNSSFFGG